MRFIRRLICTVLFIPLLFLEIMVLGWGRWLFTGESREFIYLDRLKDWADQ